MGNYSTSRRSKKFLQKCRYPSQTFETVHAWCNLLPTKNRVSVEGVTSRFSSLEGRVCTISKMAWQLTFLRDQYSLKAKIAMLARQDARYWIRYCRFSKYQDSWKKGICGYDGGKKVKGRKRHILVDHSGFLITAQVSAGHVGDRAGLLGLMYFSKDALPTNVYVDLGYKGQEFAQGALRQYGIKVITVARRASKAFAVQARRWIVERTFAWMGKARRLSKDYELLLSSSRTMMYLSMIRIMLRKIIKKI